MGFLRSAYSNPVEAGIRSFGEVTRIINDSEDAAQKRKDAPLRSELLAQEVADRRLAGKRERANMAHEAEARAREKQVWGKADELDAEIKKDFEGAVGKDAEVKAGTTKYTDKEGDALLTATEKFPHFDLDKLDEQADAAGKLKAGLAHLEPQIMNSPNGQVIVNREQAPELFDSFEKLYGDRVNTGADQHGMGVDSHGVQKKIKSVLIDKTTDPPTMSFKLEVTTPVKEGQTFKHIGDDTPKFSVASDVKGMAEKGNIDLSKRPVVRNADGSVSTVRSISVEMDGKEVLLPTISDNGKTLTREEAVAEYRKTGKHLGKFDSIDEANAYSEQLHSDPMWAQDVEKYSAKGQTSTSYDAPMTHDHGSDPNAPVVKVPLPLLGAKVDATQQHLARLQMLQAQMDPKAWLAKKEKARETIAENKRINSAMKGVDTSKPVDEQRKQFVTAFTKDNPTASVRDTVELAKTLIAEKAAPVAGHTRYGSPEGKQVGDRADLVMQYGPKSQQVKDFDEAIASKKDKGEKNPTEASLAVAAADPDPDISGPAKKALAIIEKHSAKKNAPKEAADRSVAEADKVHSYHESERAAIRKEDIPVDVMRQKLADIDAAEEAAINAIESGTAKSAAKATNVGKKKAPPKPVAVPADEHKRIVDRVNAKLPKGTPAEKKALAEKYARDKGYDPGAGVAK